MGAGKGRKMDCPPQPPGGLAGPRWRSLGCEPPVRLRCDGGRSRRATGRAASCSGPFAGMSLRRPLQAGSSRSSGLSSNPSSSERPAETPRTPPLPHGRLQSPPGRTLVSQREAAWPRGRQRPPGQVPPPRPGSGIIPVRPDEHLEPASVGTGISPPSLRGQGQPHPGERFPVPYSPPYEAGDSSSHSGHRGQLALSLRGGSLATLGLGDEDG